MIDDMVTQLGMVNIALMAVAVSLLIVVILFMAYFRTLVSIAHFAYPNAKFRARGVHFIREDTTTPLIESRNMTEVFSEIEKTGTEMPKDIRDDPDRFEDVLERTLVQDIIDVRQTVPNPMRPFVDAWMLRYDVKMIKRVLKGIRSELSKDELKRSVFPVHIVDEEMLEELVNSRDMHEVFNILKETPFGELFTGAAPEENFFIIDQKLDAFAFGRLKATVLRAETEDQSAVKIFVGKYTDILNIKTILRGLNAGLTGKELQGALLPAGRELPLWKLEKMCESGTMDESMVELEGTSYSGLRKVGKDLYEMEKFLDTMLLNITSHMMTQYILSVGPTMRFLMGKEYEVRNIKAIVRGIAEGLESGAIKEMMILEGTA